MKKITTILMLLMLTCMGAKAQVISKWSSDLVPVTKDAVVASAGSGARYAFRMPSKTKPGWCDFVNEAGALNDLSDAYLFTIEPGYKLKRISDGQFLSGNAQFNGTGIALTLTNRVPTGVSDYDTGYSNSTPFVSFDNASGAHYNCGNGDGGLQFRGGTGGWSVYVAYGPIWKNVTINYMCGDEPVQDSKNGYAIGGTVEAPAITGYEIVGATSETINADDQVITFTYQKAAVNYSISLIDMPEGTTVKIGETPIPASGEYQLMGAVTESDVTVTFPAEIQEFMTYSVDISGTSITVYFEDSRVVTNIIYSINTGTFSSNNNWTNGWTSTATNPFVKLTVPANNIQRSTGDIYSGANGTTYTLTAQPGYVITGYTIVGTSKEGVQTLTPAAGGSAVAFNTDQQYTLNVRNLSVNSTSFAQSTPNKGIAISSFVIKVKQDPNYVPVTYVITEGGETIYTSDPVLTAIGTVTELPDDLKRSAWYDYEAFSVNVTAETTTITVAATAKENQPVKYTEDATSPYYYNMNIRSKYLVYNSTATGEVTLQDTSEPFNPNAAWAFIGNPYAGFRLINQAKGTGYNLIYTSVVPGANHGNNNIQFQTVADAGEKVWLVDTNNSGIVLRMKENQSIYFHHDNGNNFLRTCALGEYQYVHDDAGSTIILTTDKEVLVQLYNLLNEKKDFVGEGLNKYSVSGMTADEFLTLLNNVKSDLDNDNTGNFLNDYNALNAITIAINQPETGFYRIKGYSGNYITLNTAGSNASMSGEANINNIVCYTPDNQLVFYANGLGMYNTSIVAPLGETLNTYTFLEGAQAGHYYIKSNASDMGTYCYDNTANGSKVDRNGSPVTSGSYETDWTLEEVTELPITLRSTDGTNYFATFSAPVNVQISGASLNTVTNNNKTAAYNTVDTDVLKAGVGVLLSGTSDKATATIITDEVADANYGLVSYYAATAGTGDETKYYLGKSKKSGQAGFYKLGEGTTSNGFKAYLENTTGEAKEGFDLEFAGVTGIDNMENGTLNMENGAVYNLQGQKVNKAQKGVFIQNGKKVVLK